ncbi:MAG: 6-carboxytetrahydropterin synthase QueD [Acidobacteria bacterium]|nr:6-carboxytetrahydropterin synthase QueD [Acidobacteriota bacterium]
MKLGVIDHIDCAHFIPGHDKCGVLHGHTYRVEVVIEGDNSSGRMIMDFAELKKAVKEVLSLYDHKTLNDILDFPSVENICESIKNRLTERIPFPLTLRVWEGHGKWVEM